MGCKFSTVKRNFTEDNLTHEIDYDQVYTIYRNPPSAPSANGPSAPSYDTDMHPRAFAPALNNNLQNPPSNSVHFMTTSKQNHFS